MIAPGVPTGGGALRGARLFAVGARDDGSAPSGNTKTLEVALLRRGGCPAHGNVPICTFVAPISTNRSAMRSKLLKFGAGTRVAAYGAMAARSGSERDQMMRGLIYMVVASSVLASVASAEDRGQGGRAAHDMMRQAMLERIAIPRDLPMRPDEIMVRGAGAAATAASAAHDHAMRMRRSEAEQAAHSRAAAHGIRQPGAARREQERRPTGGANHGGSMGWDGGSDMGCGDAAGNWRNMDMHRWWDGGGGMPMGGWQMNLRATDPAGAGTSAPASPTTR